MLFLLDLHALYRKRNGTEVYYNLMCIAVFAVHHRYVRGYIHVLASAREKRDYDRFSEVLCIKPDERTKAKSELEVI